MDVATSERLLDVAGICILARTSTPEDLGLLSRVLGRREPDPGAARDPVILALGADEPDVPTRTPDFAGPYGDHWVEDGIAHFRHHWGLSARITRGEVIMGGPAEGYRRWVTVRNSMLFVLAHLYMDRGRFLLHAAALHHQGETGFPDATLLVVGDSGRGKSTLTFAGLQAGLEVMGDDMVVVTPTENGLVAQGVPRVLTVPSDILSEAHGMSEILPGDDRNRIELEDYDLHRGEALITMVVLSDHDDGNGRLSPVPPTGTIEQLAGAFVLSALTAPMRRWFPNALKLANGPTIGLRHAADPETRLSRAVEMLDQLTRPDHLGSPTIDPA